MSAQMSGEAMGQGGTMSMQMYMVPSENNTIKVYTGADAGEGMEWSVTEVENEAVSQIKDMLANGEMITDLPIAFELKDGTVEVGGKQCYALVSSLTWEDAMNLYAYAIEATGGMIPVESMLDEETMETMTYLLGGLVIGFIVRAVLESEMNNVQEAVQADRYLDPGSVNLHHSADYFLYRTVNRVKREKESGSSHSSSSSMCWIPQMGSAQGCWVINAMAARELVMSPPARPFMHTKPTLRSAHSFTSSSSRWTER
jgi:hypothetical protein